MSTITIKAGDTLTLPMTWSADGTDVDLTGYTVTAHVRRRADELVDTLTCTPDADQATNPGVLVVSATAEQTALWPVANLECDVRFESGDGSTTHTDTFEIKVEKAITR